MYASVYVNRPSLIRALFSSFGWQFAFAGVFKLVNDGAVFGGPLLLSAIVTFVQDDDDPLWYVKLYSVIFAYTSYSNAGTVYFSADSCFSALSFNRLRQINIFILDSVLE